MSATIVYRPRHLLNLRETLAPLGRGPADPTTIWEAGALWRTFRTPEGPVTLHLSGLSDRPPGPAGGAGLEGADGSRRPDAARAWGGPAGPGGSARRGVTGLVDAVRVTAWGPGTDWALAAVPDLLGASDRSVPDGSALDSFVSDGSVLGGSVPGGSGRAVLSAAAGVRTADCANVSASAGAGTAPPRAAVRGDAAAAPGRPIAPSEAGLRRVRAAAREHPGLRLVRTGLPLEALVPAILEQRVTTVEAYRSWARLLREHGEPAPGRKDGDGDAGQAGAGAGVPERLRVFPAPETWRRIPSWQWHRAGVDPRRGRAVLAVCGRAAAVARTAGLDGAAARDALASIPGVGVWTAAETVQRSHGDPDAVSVGDYHLSAYVGTVLAGRPVDDEQMLRLLAPWAGRRQRIVRLLLASGVHVPRHGPRATIQDHRRH